MALPNQTVSTVIKQGMKIGKLGWNEWISRNKWMLFKRNNSLRRFGCCLFCRTPLLSTTAADRHWWDPLVQSRLTPTMTSTTTMLRWNHLLWITLLVPSFNLGCILANLITWNRLFSVPHDCPPPCVSAGRSAVLRRRALQLQLTHTGGPHAEAPLLRERPKEGPPEADPHDDRRPLRPQWTHCDWGGLN